ncbi:MAG: hypothetical protein M1831_005544 [Alyxoria varia]|nr:MAG: hypothetical protein M1831_005544 [Alyxoria varia]
MQRDILSLQREALGPQRQVSTLQREVQNLQDQVLSQQSTVAGDADAQNLPPTHSPQPSSCSNQEEPPTSHLPAPAQPPASLLTPTKPHSLISHDLGQRFRSEVQAVMTWVRLILLRRAVLVPQWLMKVSEKGREM